MTFVENFYLEKISNCEKALYSLKNIGCNPHKLHPHAIGFIYKQYCQSIVKFGFEYVYLRKTFLNKLDIRQNILLKNILGIHHRARFKVVLNGSLMYARHKVFGWRQCVMNDLTEKIYKYTSADLNMSNYSLSFSNQLSTVIGSKKITLAMRGILEVIAEEYICNDEDLKEQVENVMKCLHLIASFKCIYELNKILKIIVIK